jgi:hypothetical protein
MAPARNVVAPLRCTVLALALTLLRPSLQPSAAPPTPAAPPCNPSAAYVADLTVPDDTSVTAGDWFVKVWRLRNDGTCPWPPGSALAFVDGDRMDEVSDPAILAGAVPPGATTDIAVPLVAPVDPGENDANWQMRDPLGRWFGPKLTINIESVFPPDILAANKAKAPFVLVAPREVGPGQDFKVKVVFRNGEPGGYWCVRGKLTANNGYSVDDPGTGSLDRTYGGESSALNFKVTAPSTLTTTTVLRASVQWSKGLGCNGPAATSETTAPVTTRSPWTVTVVAPALCPNVPPKVPPSGVVFTVRDSSGRLLPDGDEPVRRAKFQTTFTVPPRVATYKFFAGWTCLSAAPAAYQVAGQKVTGFTLPGAREQLVTIAGNNRAIYLK